MARLQRYLHAVASGYLVLAASALFALGSIPVALHYLGKEEFGVWAMASQLALYLALLDFGIAPAITRILVEHKDGPLFGRVVATAWLVQVAQAVIILVAGVVVVTALADVIGVRPEWAAPFRQVMLMLTGLLSLSFLTRIFLHLLDAHQRQHLTNYAQLLLLGVNFVVLLFCLRAGYGLLSLPLGQLAGWLAQTALCLIASLRLRLMPRLVWHLHRPALAELVALGRDVFLAQCGAQLIMSSQVILLGRWLGPDAAATWSVCTRPFFLLLSSLCRPFDHSLPALAEMMTRGETTRLAERVQALIRITVVSAAVVAVALAFLNRDFVQVWTHGRVGWSATNDALLGAWILLLAFTHVPIMLIITTKRVGLLRYMMILDGLFSLVLAHMLLKRWGVPGLLLGYIGGNLALHGAYGFVRTARMFCLSSFSAARAWFGPAVPVLLVTGVAGWAVHAALGSAPALVRMLCTGMAIGVAGLFSASRWGVNNDDRQALIAQARHLFRKVTT